MTAHELLEQVDDADSFLVFAQALLADREASLARQASARGVPGDHRPGDWANTTLTDFLDGAIAWAQDSRFGLDQGLSSSNPWRQFAVFLYCGTLYE